MRVLIVEDESLLAESSKTLLERKGFTVETAYDGISGAEYAETGIYDLLILDVMRLLMQAGENNTPKETILTYVWGFDSDAVENNVEVYIGFLRKKLKAIPHNSKCRYGERGAAAAKPKAQIILCVLSSILATQMPCRTPSRSEALRSATAACGGSWRGDPPERCLSRKARIVRCCLYLWIIRTGYRTGRTGW